MQKVAFGYQGYFFRKESLLILDIQPTDILRNRPLKDYPSKAEPDTSLQGGGMWSFPFKLTRKRCRGTHVFEYCCLYHL
jgi:hypothetical protein